MPLKRGARDRPDRDPGVNWYLDDLPPMMFIKKSPNSHGFVNPRDIEQIWRDQFDWVYREMDYAVFPITIHPDVSGRPQVLMMLERLYAHMVRHAGVRFVTMNEMADDFARRFPAQEVAAHVFAVRRYWVATSIGRMRSRGRVCTRAMSTPIERRRERRNRDAHRQCDPGAVRHDAFRLAGHVIPVVDAHRQDARSSRISGICGRRRNGLPAASAIRWRCR